eukprot:gene14113-20065_t
MGNHLTAAYHLHNPAGAHSLLISVPPPAHALRSSPCQRPLSPVRSPLAPRCIPCTKGDSLMDFDSQVDGSIDSLADSLSIESIDSLVDFDAQMAQGIDVADLFSPHADTPSSFSASGSIQASWLPSTTSLEQLTRDLSPPSRDAGPASTTSSSPTRRDLRYGTVMLKLSGEALSGDRGSGVDPDMMNWIAQEIAEVAASGMKVAVVVGGGNYFRGATAAHKGLERATADYVGMLATVMNSLQLQAALEYLGVPTRVQTAIEMREVAEPYIRRRAMAHLNAGRVVIFGAGTGNPFFTTDTAAALRAAEINADVFVKCTKVDGIYDSDPAYNPTAKKYEQLSYRQCTDQKTAITLCKENKMPVMVLNMLERGNIMRAMMGENVGTLVN